MTKNVLKNSRNQIELGIKTTSFTSLGDEDKNIELKESSEETNERDKDENEDDDDDDDGDNHGGLTELVRDVVGEIFRSPLNPSF